MFLKAFTILLVLIAIFLIFIAFQSPNYRIAREQFIQAPPSEIFPHINNSQKANAWMPWKDDDPQVQITYSGPEEGVGSISQWTSEGRMGVGQAKVSESIPDKLVKTDLSYTKPMEMSQLAEISLTPKGDGTIVKWTVTGQNSFIGRVFCFFMNMDKMIGGQFEKGLLKLKSTVEKK